MHWWCTRSKGKACIKIKNSKSGKQHNGNDNSNNNNNSTIDNNDDSDNIGMHVGGRA